MSSENTGNKDERNLRTWWFFKHNRKQQKYETVLTSHCSARYISFYFLLFCYFDNDYSALSASRRSATLTAHSSSFPDWSAIVIRKRMNLNYCDFIFPFFLRQVLLPLDLEINSLFCLL